MGRKPCCAKEGLNKGAWTAPEDKILASYIKTHGEGKWRNLPKRAGLKRCGKSCRLRWLNYLRPGIKRGNISDDEEELIIRLHKLLGNRWSLIAGRLPGRTDNEIKNYWNTTLGKRVQGQQAQLPKPKSKEKWSTSVPQTADKSPPKAPADATVIKTKALRCTKAFFPQGQHLPSPLPVKSAPEESGDALEIPQNGDPLNSFSDSHLLQAMGDGISAGDNALREGHYNFSLSMSSDELLLLDGSNHEDWMASCYFLPDIAFDCQSSTPFLGSEEWI